MNTWRKVLAVSLAVWLPIVSLEAKARPDPTAIQQKVNDLGVDADVKLKLADGKKLRGHIQAIADEDFQVALEREATPRTLSYNQIAELKLADVYYRADSQPDPIEARRTVVGLGIGKHVMVKLAGGRKVHGNIETVEADHFTLLPDHQATALPIAYADIWQVEPNLSRTGWIIVVAAVAAVIVVIAVAAAYYRSI